MYPCANCSANADYSYQVNDSIITHYCEQHLPYFLQSKKNSGEITLITPPVIEEKPSKKKKEEEVIVETVAEEVASEDADN
jgi:hypothetical protein